MAAASLHANDNVIYRSWTLKVRVDTLRLWRSGSPHPLGAARKDGCFPCRCFPFQGKRRYSLSSKTWRVLPLAAAAGPVWAADPAAGEADFKKICAKCHTIAADQAGKKKLDPPLHGVIGRKAGSVAGFRYSGAMTASNVVWSARTLDGWLTKPKDFIPKTRMPFGGWTQAERRANVIAYVREASK